MVINSINGLNNVEIRVNDVHGMEASEPMLPSIWRECYFLVTIQNPREVKLLLLSLFVLKLAQHNKTYYTGRNTIEHKTIQ